MANSSMFGDILERYYDSLHMQGRLPMFAPERPVAPEPLYVASPPVQPKAVAKALQTRNADEIARHRCEEREKHILALAELLPGKKWRY